MSIKRDVNPKVKRKGNEKRCEVEEMPLRRDLEEMWWRREMQVDLAELVCFTTEMMGLKARCSAKCCVLQ